MTTITATVRGGRLEVVEPINLPDGTELRVQLPDAGPSASLTPDEICQVLRAMDAVEPFDLSAAERAAWEAERTAQKAREKAQFAEQSEQLRRLWDDPVPPG